MEQHALKNVSGSLNANIYSYLETSGSQSSNLYLNVVPFFNTSINKTSVVAWDSCFPALASKMQCSIVTWIKIM
jgi:hypothetical protein